MDETRPIADDANRYELLVQSVTDYAIYMLDRDGVGPRWPWYREP